MFRVYVGVPQNDKLVTVTGEETVTELLEKQQLKTSGLIQHNGATLKAQDLGKKLKDIGFTEGDMLYVVQKLDNA